MSVQWTFPETVDEALLARSDAEDAVIVAGGTFVGVLLSSGLLSPERVVALSRVGSLRDINTDEELVLGALATHTEVSRHGDVRSRWPALARAFAVVASGRIRNQATVGGVLGDADYASDPPAMLVALDATVWLQSLSRGLRAIPAKDFILGHYSTAMHEDELITHVSVPSKWSSSSYWKFRTRSSEDRPCAGVAIAAVIRDNHIVDVRVAVGAVSDRPVYFEDLCNAARGRSVDDAARLLADGYRERVEPISDQRASSNYRRKVLSVGIRRGLEELSR